jgi:hypothetical protein
VHLPTQRTASDTPSQKRGGRHRKRIAQTRLRV